MILWRNTSGERREDALIRQGARAPLPEYAYALRWQDHRAMCWLTDQPRESDILWALTADQCFAAAREILITQAPPRFCVEQLELRLQQPPAPRQDGTFGRRMLELACGVIGFPESAVRWKLSEDDYPDGHRDLVDWPTGLIPVFVVVTRKIEIPETLSVMQAADALGITRRSIYHAVQNDQIPGAINDAPANPARGSWRIPLAGLRAYSAQRGRARDEQGRWAPRGEDPSAQ